MTIKLTQRIQSIQPSATLSISAHAARLRAEGRDIINLSVGEPDFDTPDFIKVAAIQAMQNGQTKYTPASGTPALRQAVAQKFSRDNHLDYTEKQILVSCGAKHSLFNAINALVESGDEVIIPAPYWVSYPEMVRLTAGKPVIIKTTIEQGLKLSPDQLAAAITPKTKLLIINSPSNPSGVTYTHSDLKALADVLLKHPQIFIITDDIYEHIQWGNTPFCNLLNVCPQLGERTLVVNGVSKAYAMTGWRIGFAAGPEPLIAAMAKLQSQSTSNPNSIAQAAAQAAITGDQTPIKIMVKAFKQRHQLVYNRLIQIPEIQCLETQATFYCFPYVQDIINTLHLKTDIDFAKYLLEKAELAIVPGSAFGLPGFIRLSFASSEAILNKALDRLEKLLKP